MSLSLRHGERLTWLMFLLAGFLLTGCGETVPNYPARTPPADFTSAARIRTGAELFASHCASCHGDTSEGRSPRADFFVPPAPDFRTSKYPAADPAYLYWRIAKGKSVEPFRRRGSVMPSWEAYLGSDQIWDLVAYLQTRY